MSEPAPSLAALRGLHATTGDSLAPALVMLMAGLLAGAICVFLVGPWIDRRRALRRASLAALDESQRLPANERLVAQAAVLRQIALQIAGDDAARLQGDAWLSQLDRIFATTAFTAGPARCFGTALYRRNPEADASEVDRLLHTHIAKLRR